MGSSSYDRDVYSSSSTSSWGASTDSTNKLRSSTLDPSMSPFNRKIKSTSKNPVVIVLDVTGSNINFARLLYDKFPMFYEEIRSKSYLEDFDISICAVGDKNSDNYPFQVGDFAKGIELDSWLEKIVLEGGGGGQHRESYELMAYYLLKQTEFEKDANPILIFIGDEMSYTTVNKDDVKNYFDLDLPKTNTEIPVNNYNPFDDLNKKYNNNVFMMLNKYCGFTWDQEIIDHWKELLPPEHLIKVAPEEKAIVDLMLGTIALLNKRKLNLYALDMLGREQTKARITGVIDSLTPLSTSLITTEDINTDLSNVKQLRKVPGKGKRII